jgi:transcriptional regulator with XRE-family HTH domain
MSKRTHRGGDFREFLKEQGILGEVEARALKQAMSLQISRLLDEKSVTKAEMAVRMKTSRAAVDRLLDASNSSVTLNTLGKAARALGRKVKIELVPASLYVTKEINKKPRPANGRGCFFNREEVKFAQTTVIWPADDNMVNHFGFKELPCADQIAGRFNVSIGW